MMRRALSHASKHLLRQSEELFAGASGATRSFTSSRSLCARRAAVFGVAGAAIYFTNLETTPVTKRSRLILFPSSWEAMLGDIAVKQVVSQEAIVYPGDHPRTRLVKDVVSSLAEQVNKLDHLPSHLRSIDWKVTVVESKTVNAMAAPGGRIIVFAGIMDLLTRKEELAAVIAHEMAHVLARHSAESMTAAAVTLPLRIAAALLLESGTGMFDAMHTVLVALPASRAAETEADAIGMHLAARACYQPSGMISMLTKLDQMEKHMRGDKKPAFMRTHPLTSERIEAAKRQVSDARRIMEMSECSLFTNFFEWGLAGSVDSTIYSTDGSFR